MAILKVLTAKRSPGSIEEYLTKEGKTRPDLVQAYEADGMQFGRQFERIQELFEKTSGRRYYHYILSLKPEETEHTSPEKVNALGYELAEKAFGEKGYQFAVVTHIDTDHLHDHIIVNAVSFTDGTKLHTTAKDLQALKEQVNILCREYGLEPIPEPEKKITDGEYWTQSRGIDPWKQELRDVIALVQTRTKTYDEFKKTLKDEWGIDVVRDTGKGMTYIHPNGKKVRGRKLGDAYDKPALTASFAPDRQQAEQPHRRKVAVRRISPPRTRTVRRGSAVTAGAGALSRAVTDTPESAYHGRTKDEDEPSKDEAMQRERELYRGWER